MERYFITDPSYYNSLDSFEKYLTSVYKNHRVDYSCFRDKVNPDISSYIDIFLSVSKKYSIKKTILNSNIDARFFGVHLTSKQFELVKKAKERNLFVIISTHNEQEIIKAKELNADAITYSPIFFTPKKSEPKGVESLKKMVELASPIKCFGLGGIVSQKEIKEIKRANPYGFASIRYFVNYHHTNK